MKKLLTALAIILLLTACNSNETIEAPQADLEIEQGPVYATFTLNAQEFMTPDLSLEVIESLVELHDDFNIPLDIFFADFLVQELDETSIFEELADNFMIAVSYHIRLPMPYTNWDGIKDWESLSYDERYDKYLQYESFTIDPVSGELTNQPGGYSYLKELLGYAPYAVGIPVLDEALVDVYADLGAQFAVSHAKSSYGFNDSVQSLSYRPETYEIKIYEYTRDELELKLNDILDRKTEEPVIINFKMHDKDFFADASAWTLMYVHHKVPYDYKDYHSNVTYLTEEEEEEIWELYQFALDYIDGHNEIWAVNLDDISLF
jgi:hypothetical protein